MTQYALPSGILDDWTGGALSLQSVDGETSFPVTITGLGKLGTATLTVVASNGNEVIWDDAGSAFNNPMDAETINVDLPIVVTNGNATTAAVFRIPLTGTGAINAWDVSSEYPEDWTYYTYTGAAPTFDGTTMTFPNEETIDA